MMNENHTPQTSEEVYTSYRLPYGWAEATERHLATIFEKPSN
jgi:hypothetical protein